MPPTPSENPVSLVQGPQNEVLEIQVPMGILSFRTRGVGLPADPYRAHGPKVAHRWADGSSDPRRSNHGTRGMLYM